MHCLQAGPALARRDIFAPYYARAGTPLALGTSPAAV
jgi:hypothetical protein